MGLEMILGIVSVVLLGAIFVLSMGRLEKMQEMRRLEEDLNEARRGSQNNGKRLDESQARYDKVSADFGRTQQQLKELKQQHHTTREQVERLKAGKRKEDPSESGQTDARRAQARVEELEGEVKAVRGKLERLVAEHGSLKKGR